MFGDEETAPVGPWVAYAAATPVMSWGQHAPRRLINSLAWIGTALLLLRAVASLIQAGYLVVVGRFHLAARGIWEPWFYLGAILFTMSTWRSRRWRNAGGTA